MSNIAAKNADAKRVERRKQRSVLWILGVDQLSQPLLHFGGGLVGERDAKDSAWSNAGLYLFRDSIRNDPCFPSPRTCQYQQGTPIGINGRFLWRIERGHENNRLKFAGQEG